MVSVDLHDLFQSTGPSRGPTVSEGTQGGAGGISIHRPLAGPDATIVCRISAIYYFNPQAPRGAEAHSECSEWCGYFNPQAPRGARQDAGDQKQLYIISIHRPLAGPDDERGGDRLLEVYFNPQAPRGARRFASLHSGRDTISIHRPLAGPDLHALDGSFNQIYFNPQAPRGARPRCRLQNLQCFDFNPQAPRGARPWRSGAGCTCSYFNPQAPRGARHDSALPLQSITDFNPQAPRGARQRLPRSACGDDHFNPQAPRGARPSVSCIDHASAVFQSTGPSRGPTPVIVEDRSEAVISIHRPLAGPDCST